MEETDKLINELVRQLDNPSDFTFLIPGWSPVDSKQGLWWMRSQLWEGFCVAYKILAPQKQVLFKYWEFGENEPQWAAQQYAT